MPAGVVDFKVAAEERAMIVKIVARAVREKLVEKGAHADGSLDLTMDLCATHANGTPLDFEKLLAADRFNFLHDICGIRRHLNRITGELENCFLPRCARPMSHAGSREQKA